MNHNTEWSELGQMMSDISQQAFYARWMDDLEFRLWEILCGGPRKYGQISLSDQQVDRLRQLSDSLGGWVIFNDELGVQEFVDRDRWQLMYDAWTRT
jgi:hypothetical protein